MLFLGGGGEEGLFQNLVFGQAFREVVAAKLSVALFIGCPEGGAGGTGDVPKDHKLDGEHFAFAGKGDVGVRDGEYVIGDEVLCVFEPPGAGQVEDGTFEGNGGEDTVERALAVGRYEEHLVAEVVTVANFASVFFAVKARRSR